ncbi:UNVERIFIED_CONTAM: hypothetical protein K2H54_034969 [Gekko kuhli]
MIINVPHKQSLRVINILRKTLSCKTHSKIQCQACTSGLFKVSQQERIPSFFFLLSGFGNIQVNPMMRKYTARLCMSRICRIRTNPGSPSVFIPCFRIVLGAHCWVIYFVYFFNVHFIL